MFGSRNHRVVIMRPPWVRLDQECCHRAISASRVDHVFRHLRVGLRRSRIHGGIALGWHHPGSSGRYRPWPEAFLEACRGHGTSWDRVRANAEHARATFHLADGFTYILFLLRVSKETFVGAKYWWAAIKSNCKHCWKKLQMPGKEMVWNCIGINFSWCRSPARSTS